jgi:hypothetical protein
MSFCTRSACPHKRGVFIWLADGPWLGDPADTDYGRYPWVHDSTRTPGRLTVCELMPFAAAEEAGETCACGHPSHEHKAGGPVPAGESSRPRPCSCGCPDFRHRPEDLERWHGKPPEAAQAAGESPLDAPVPPRPAERLEPAGGVL